LLVGGHLAVGVASFAVAGDFAPAAFADLEGHVLRREDVAGHPGLFALETADGLLKRVRPTVGIEGELARLGAHLEEDSVELPGFRCPSFAYVGLEEAGVLGWGAQVAAAGAVGEDDDGLEGVAVGAQAAAGVLVPGEQPDWAPTVLAEGLGDGEEAVARRGEQVEVGAGLEDATGLSQGVDDLLDVEAVVAGAGVKPPPPPSRSHGGSVMTMPAAFSGSSARSSAAGIVSRP